MTAMLAGFTPLAPITTDVVHPIPIRALACFHCDAELELNDERAPTELWCPNGCPVELRPNLRPESTRRRICTACGLPIARAPGQIGRSPAKHPACYSDGDRRRRAALTQKNRERAAANPDWWKQYQKHQKPAARPATPLSILPPLESPAE